ncbi:hypothetical protein HAX54_030862, partial [Datura stramonium]|nr:hypothetical protein [Datura stramonium]
VYHPPISSQPRSMKKLAKMTTSNESQLQKLAQNIPNLIAETMKRELKKRLGWKEEPHVVGFDDEEVYDEDKKYPFQGLIKEDTIPIPNNFNKDDIEWDVEETRFNEMLEGVLFNIDGRGSGGLEE